jgi:hypothetical protein
MSIKAESDLRECCRPVLKLFARESDHLASFDVHGPFAIGYEKRKGGRTLTFEAFWAEDSDARYLAEERGVYVFAIRWKRFAANLRWKGYQNFQRRPLHRYLNCDGFIWDRREKVLLHSRYPNAAASITDPAITSTS